MICSHNFQAHMDSKKEGFILALNYIALYYNVFCCFFFFQFNVHFKIISAHMRPRENAEKKHFAHPQAKLVLSHMCPSWCSNPHTTQR